MADLQITTQADIQKLLSAMDRLEKKSNETAQAGEKLEKNSSAASKGLDQLAAAATGMIAAIGVREIAQAAVELYQLSAAGERAESSLNAVSEGQADEYIRAIGVASDGTIGRLDAMAASNRALQLGVVSSAEDMARLTATARTLGKVMGLDATQAMDDLVTGIGRASPMILDNLGLTVKMGEVQEEVNRVMQENVGITEAAATKIVLLNMAAEQAADIQAEMGENTRTAADDVEWFTARIEDAKLRLGDFIREGASPYISMMRESIEATQDAILTNALASDSLSEFRDEMRQTSQSAMLLNYALGLDGRGADELASVIEFLMNPTMALAGREIERTTYEAIQQVKALNDLEGGMTGARDATARMRREQQDAADASEAAAGAAEEETDAATALAQAYVDGTISLAEYEQGKRDLMTVEQLAAEKARDSAEATRELERAQQDAYRTQQGLARIAEDLAGSYTYLGNTYTYVSDANEQYTGLVEDLTDAKERLTDTIFREQFAYEAAGGDAQEYADRMEDLGNQSAALEAQLALAAERIGGTEHSYRITQLATEDLQAVGEGFLALMGQTTREAELQGAAFDNLRQKYELVTPQQLEMEHGLQMIVDAMNDGSLTVDQASDIYDDFVTGGIRGTGDLQTAIGDTKAKQQELLEMYYENERQLGVISETSGTSAGDQITDTENVSAAYDDMAAAAEGAGTRVGEALDPAISPLETANGLLFDIRRNWDRLQAHPVLNLTVNGSAPTLGGSPTARAAGGPVSAGQLYMVGEEGPEMFVPTQNGTIIPNGGSSQPLNINIALELDGRVIGQQTVRYMSDRGVDVYNMTGGAIRA